MTILDSHSLSPPATQRPHSAATAAAPMSANARRMIALTILLVCAIVLGVAAWLEPSPTGMGTHQQLRMPPCGWIVMADMPCPTCGMTTAFAHAANGNLWQAFLAQPLGCILAVSMAMIALVSIHVVITGSKLGGAFSRLWGRRMAWTLTFAVVAAWGYKIAQHKGWI